MNKTKQNKCQNGVDGDLLLLGYIVLLAWSEVGAQEPSRHRQAIAVSLLTSYVNLDNDTVNSRSSVRVQQSLGVPRSHR